MSKKSFLICISILLITCSVFITGCGKTNSERKSSTDSGSKTSANAQTSENKTKATSKNNTTETSEEGDGTLTITLSISNPEQKQEKYNLIFAAPSSFRAGEPIRNFKSYTVDAGASFTVNIFEFSFNREKDESGIYKIGLTAARLEDVNVRNPLSEIKVLTFADDLTCIEGKNITLNMTDKPLTSLYPEGTLLVRIVDSKNKGGYVNFFYKSTTNKTLKYGKGSSGPDFLVPFEATEFKTKGIRDAVLVISDEQNQALSEEMELQFDENGYCKQGQYIEMKVKS